CDHDGPRRRAPAHVVLRDGPPRVEPACLWSDSASDRAARSRKSAATLSTDGSSASHGILDGVVFGNAPADDGASETRGCLPTGDKLHHSSWGDDQHGRDSAL